MIDANKRKYPFIDIEGRVASILIKLPRPLTSNPLELIEQVQEVLEERYENRRRNAKLSKRSRLYFLLLSFIAVLLVFNIILYFV